MLRFARPRQREIQNLLTTENAEHTENFKSVLVFFRVFCVFRG